MSPLLSDYALFFRRLLPRAARDSDANRGKCSLFSEHVRLLDELQPESGAQAKAATRFDSRDIFRATVFLWSTPLATPRANSG